MYILLLLIASVSALPCTRQRILDCFDTHVDTNGNHIITSSELQHFIIYNECALFVPPVSPSTMITQCDKNGDGMLSVEDYDAPTSCMNSVVLREAICQWCDKCDSQ